MIVASARGGVYSTSEAMTALEHQESYLKVVFGFFGITDVRFVRAEGLAMGEAAKEAALAAAQIEIVTPTQAPAANQEKAAPAAWDPGVRHHARSCPRKKPATAGFFHFAGSIVCCTRPGNLVSQAHGAASSTLTAKGPGRRRTSSPESSRPRRTSAV